MATSNGIMSATSLEQLVWLATMQLPQPCPQQHQRPLVWHLLFLPPAVLPSVPHIVPTAAGATGCDAQIAAHLAHSAPRSASSNRCRPSKKPPVRRRARECRPPLADRSTACLRTLLPAPPWRHTSGCCRTQGALLEPSPRQLQSRPPSPHQGTAVASTAGERRVMPCYAGACHKKRHRKAW